MSTVLGNIFEDFFTFLNLLHHKWGRNRLWSPETKYGTKYSGMDQVKFVGDSFENVEGVWSTLSRSYSFNFFIKAVFHTFYLVHSWILCPIYNLTCKLNQENWKKSLKSLKLKVSVQTATQGQTFDSCAGKLLPTKGFPLKNLFYLISWIWLLNFIQDCLRKP